MKSARGFFSVYGMLLLLIPMYGIQASALEAGAQNQVGIAAAVRGDVKILSQAQGEKIAQNGQAIFLGDQVTTEKDGNLQILLLDETTFTVGPNSAVAIDKFVYDPETHDGDVKARVVKGVFRFVTGKIGQKNPEKMEVDIPSGTIGIRGTIVAGEVAGEKSTIVLLGPGENNNTSHRQGKFTLTSESGGKSFQQTVNKSGFGSTIEGDGMPPSKPFHVPAEQLNKITGSLNIAPTQQEQAQTPGGSGGQGDASPAEPGKGESPTQQSGQGKAEAKVSVKDARMMNRLFQKLGLESDDASQQALDNVGTIILNGPSSRDQLQQAAQRLGPVVNHFYSQSFKVFDGAGTNQIGTGTFNLDIDFGSRTVGGNNSRIDLNLSSSTPSISGTPVFKLFHGGSDPEPAPFGFGSANAMFDQFDIPNSGGGCSGSQCNNADVHIGVNNVGGIIAGSADFNITVKQTTGPNAPVVAKGGDVAPSVPGPS